MINKIKNFVLSKLKIEYSKKVSQFKGVIPYLFDRFLSLLIISFGYFVSIYLIRTLFGVKIVRSFMIIVVSIMELIIIFQTKYSNFDEEFKDIPDQNKKSTLYYANLIMYGIKKLINNLYFVLPFLIAYGIFRSANLIYYFNCLISMILLPITTIAISMILPNFKKSNSKIFAKFINLISMFLSIVFYLVVFALLKTNINLVMHLLSNDFSMYQSTSNILNLPINLSELLKLDLFSILSFALNFTSVDSSVLFVLSLILLIFSFAIFVLSFKEICNKKLLTKHKKIFNIRKNNTIVFRINKILKSCLPRSPTLSLQLK